MISEQNKHHPFSPSKLDRMFKCPASYHIALGLPDVESAYALEGKELHREMEEIINTGIFDAKKYTPEHQELLESCLRFLGKFGIKEKKTEVYVEITNDCEMLTCGTADLVIIDENDDLSVIDWKFGFSDLDHIEQLRAYAVGVMQKEGRRECYAYAVKPRLKIYEKYFFELEPSLQKIETIIERTSDILDFHISQQCKYCKALAVCPIQTYSMQNIDGEIKSIQSLPDIDIISMYEKGKDIQKKVDQIQEEIMRRCEKNGTCENYEVVARKGNRKIIDIEGTYEALKECLSPSEFLGACDVSVAKLESVYVEKQAEIEHTTKTAQKAKLYSLIKEKIVTTKDKLILQKIKGK